MEHEPKTYFKEHEYDDVKGFTVLEAEDGKYHIAEKWLASEKAEADDDGEACSPPENDTWMDYWISEDDLARRSDEGECEAVGELTDDQFAAVAEAVGWAEEVVA